jgi:hypothetical protein
MKETMVTMVTKWVWIVYVQCCLLQDKSDLKTLLDLGTKDLCISLNHLVDIHDILYGGAAIEGHIGAIISNPIATL